MRIDKLSLTNFRGFEALEIDFPEGEGGLAVFIGVNGSGKSSVLDSVFYHLRSVYGILRQINNSEKRILFGSLPVMGDKLNKENINIHSTQLNLKSLWVTNKNKIEISNSLKKDEAGNFSDDSYRISKIEKGKENEFPVIAFYKTNRGITSNPSLKAMDLSTVKIEESFQLNDTQAINFNYFFEWFRNTEDYENEQRLYSNPNYRHSGLEIFRKILTTFLAGYENPRVRRQPTEKLILEKGDTLLSVTQLSHGEKLIFAIIGDIIRRISITQPSLKNPLLGKGIIMIDEIEQHLHPSWQRIIIPNLRKTFPSIQFIITTHSPQVLSNVPRENVFILEDFKLVEKTPHTLGRDTNSILYDLFGVKARPEHARKEFNQLYRLLDDPEAEELAKSMLNEMEEKYGTEDSEIVRAKLHFDFLMR